MLVLLGYDCNLAIVRFNIGYEYDFIFTDQKKEAMATDGGKSGGGDKGKTSGSQVSKTFALPPLALGPVPCKHFLVP